MTASAGLASGFVLIFVFAVLVVIVGTVGLLIKLLGMMLRGLTGGGSADANAEQARYTVCRTAGCGCENPRAARYCAQCGMPLSRSK
jgi:hypothetical protein